MGVLNLPNLPANTGSKNPEAAASVVAPMLQQLMKGIAAKEELARQKAETEKQASALEAILNVGRAKTVPTGQTVASYSPEQLKQDPSIQIAALQGKPITTQEIEGYAGPDVMTPQEKPNPEYFNVPRDTKVVDDLTKSATGSEGLDKLLGIQVATGRTPMEKAMEMKAKGNSLFQTTTPSGDIVIADKKHPEAGVRPIPGAGTPTVTRDVAVKDPTDPTGQRTIVVRSDARKTGVQGEKVSPLEIALARAKAYNNERPVAYVDESGAPIWGTFEQAKGHEAPQYSPDVKGKLAEAAQRGGARSASVRTAAGVFAKEAPEIIKLRHAVAAKGMLPDDVKDVNKVNQWMGVRFDDPDVTELQKKTKLLADSLQRTVGGSQGGQWAYEVAADILDPTLGADSFERVVLSHQKSLERMAAEYENFGRTPTPKANAGQPIATKVRRFDANGNEIVTPQR